MTTATTFGSVLSRIRKEQGFTSAHQFFKSVGGKRALGFTFMTYWNMEHGKRFSNSRRLKTIMAAMGIEMRSPRAQELVRAYVRTLLNSDDMLDILSASAAHGADLPSRELAELATHQALAQRNVNLTFDQWKLRARDIVAYICSLFLSNTEGWVTVRELSNATKLKPELIRKALKALASGGAVEFSEDRVRDLFAKNVLKRLPMTPTTAAIKAALLNLKAKCLTDSKLIDKKDMTVRMTKANLELYRQHLEKAVDLASIYGDVEADRQGSAVYLMEGRIFQIFPRD
jgi:hypothetical protein